MGYKDAAKCSGINHDGIVPTQILAGKRAPQAPPPRQPAVETAVLASKDRRNLTELETWLTISNASSLFKIGFSCARHSLLRRSSNASSRVCLWVEGRVYPRSA